MNFLVFLPFALIIVPFIPTLIEFFRRKDKGPRDVPEQTTHEEKPDVEVPRIERARGEARAKEPGEVIRVIGNISIPDRTEVKNHLVVQGNLRLGKNCHLHGSVKAFGGVEIGEYSLIEGHVLSEGKIHVGRESIVKGVVDSLQEVVLEENAVVGAVSTEKTVRLGLGAKIDRRILSGTSITTFVEQPPASKVVTIPPPPFETEQPKEPEKKIGKITNQIFGSLEDRIRKFDETKQRPTERVKVEGLSPEEVKVLKLASVCSSLEEICLRLFMDPPEVQEILSGLIEKGYLDRDLRIIKPEAKEVSATLVPDKTSEMTKQVREPSEEEKKEHIVSAQKPIEGSLPEDELLERLIASKMREELRKKIEGKMRATKIEKGTANSETTTESDTKQKESKSIIKEWERAWSLLWRNEGKEEQNNPGRPHTENSVEQAGALVEKRNRRGLKKIWGVSSNSNGASERTTCRFGGFEKETSASADSFRNLTKASKGVSKPMMLGGTGHKGVVSKWIFLLPILTLTMLLSAEVSYYSPSSFVFLGNLLPSNLTVWPVFLALAIGFGTMSGLTTLKHLNQARTLNEDSGGKIRNG